MLRREVRAQRRRAHLRREPTVLLAVAVEHAENSDFSRRLRDEDHVLILLAKTACAKLGSSVNGEIMEQIQPALWSALGAAQQYSGCSTVCMMRLELQQETPKLGCYILGDSGCVVLRANGESGAALIVAETTEINMHENGAPFQLGGLDCTHAGPRTLDFWLPALLALAGITR